MNVEKPTNVRVAEAIGEMTMRPFEGTWRVKREHVDGPRQWHTWEFVPPYDTDPAAALEALEAYGERRGLNYSVERCHGGQRRASLWKEEWEPSLAIESSETMPAAVCAAILAAEGK